MRFKAVAADYDRTLANDGQVSKKTLKMLVGVRESGRKLILITGREIESLGSVCPDLSFFDLIVAENGALLYWPSTGEEKPLCKIASAEFVEALKRSGANPLSVGRCVVATVRPYEVAAHEAARRLSLDLQVIFNRESVMVLPAGVDKGTGFRAALAELHLPSESVLGIGDGENDYAFLNFCGFSVAVANAIPRLKEQVHMVTSGKNGTGVVEVLQKLLEAEASFNLMSANLISPAVRRS
jgi:hydroxymethylpyrimidine pyrophosphatase-like HAD family hydrolase